MFNVEKLKRNPEKIKKLLQPNKEGYLVTDDIYVIIPERFNTIGLCKISSFVQTLTLYAIVDKHNNYGLMKVPSFINLTPSKVETIKVNEENYYLLTFPKGSTYTKSSVTVRRDDFAFDLISDTLVKGKVPFYVDYEDSVDLFLASKKYADSNISNFSLIFEILISISSRTKNDKDKFIRHAIKDKKEINKLIYYMALSNVVSGIKSINSKLTGSYLPEGIMSALDMEESETSNLERILRA